MVLTTPIRVYDLDSPMVVELSKGRWSAALDGTRVLTHRQWLEREVARISKLCHENGDPVHIELVKGKFSIHPKGGPGVEQAEEEKSSRVWQAWIWVDRPDGYLDKHDMYGTLPNPGKESPCKGNVSPCHETNKRQSSSDATMISNGMSTPATKPSSVGLLESLSDSRETGPK